MKLTILLAVGISFLMFGCSPKNAEPTKAEASTKPKAAASAETDPRIKKVQDQIAQTTPEEKDAIEKVKATKLTVGGAKSAVSLGEIADRFAKQPNNVGIGWQAFKYSDGNTYDIFYHFKNYKGDVLFAKWSYNAKTGEVKPMNDMGYQFSYASK